MKIMKWAPDEGHDDVVYVYLLTNDINGKKYVGISWNPPGRWEDHIEYDSAIGKALRKYGFRNFTKTVLAVGNRRCAYQLEAHYCDIHNCLVPNGYNLMVGGVGCLTISEYTREKHARNTRIALQNRTEEDKKATNEKRRATNSKKTEEQINRQIKKQIESFKKTHEAKTEYERELRRERFLASLDSKTKDEKSLSKEIHKKSMVKWHENRTAEEKKRTYSKRAKTLTNKSEEEKVLSSERMKQAGLSRWTNMTKEEKSELISKRAATKSRNNLLKKTSASVEPNVINPNSDYYSTHQ